LPKSKRKPSGENGKEKKAAIRLCFLASNLPFLGRIKLLNPANKPKTLFADQLIPFNI